MEGFWFPLLNLFVTNLTKHVFGDDILKVSTLPETNISPEKRPLEVWRFLLETRNHHFQARFDVSFRESILSKQPGKKTYIGHVFQPFPMWVFPKIGIPQNGWFRMEDPIKMDDLWVPTIFRKYLCKDLIHHPLETTIDKWMANRMKELFNF